MRYQDIFVPGGFPRHTYNPRKELQLERRLGEVKENLCKLVTICQVPDDYVLHNRRPLLLSRDVLLGVLAEFAGRARAC